MKNITSIVVVGGGSAGWMSAATLIKFFPDKKITVIDSSEIPTVGVGESTLGQLRKWTNILEIDEQDFMKHTNASYKLSIKFTDFYKKDAGGFHYPFGQPFLNSDSLNDWQVKKNLFPDTPVEDYCRTFWPSMPLVEGNKINTNKSGEFENFRFDRDVAYHFDAALFAKWLKERYCLPKGVIHIDSLVKDITQNDAGIDKLYLKDDSVIEADLFIDCTGWKSLLLGETLKEPFISYSHILPNNKAWATQIPYTDKEKELEPYTNCTAIGNGWVWNIPMWTRIGTGYVYSDKFISPEDALKEFKQHLNSNKMTVPNASRVTEDLVFKDISMRIGIHEKLWKKNVVAIGLSAGFIEPLESNGLLSVHEFLLELVRHLTRETVTQWDRDVYNTKVRSMFNNFAEFVALHFALTNRTDTPYWKSITEKSFCPEMTKRMPINISGFYDLALRKTEYLKHEGNGGINCIATGMNYLMLNIGDVLELQNMNQIDITKECNRFISNRKLLQRKWQKAADSSPTLYKYLTDNIYHNE